MTPEWEQTLQAMDENSRIAAYLRRVTGKSISVSGAYDLINGMTPDERKAHLVVAALTTVSERFESLDLGTPYSKTWGESRTRSPLLPLTGTLR